MRSVYQKFHRRWQRPFGKLVLLAAAVGLFMAGTVRLQAQMKENPKMMQMIKKMKQKAVAKDYVRAHMKVKNPKKLLGGPIEVTVTQNSGGVFVALPDFRRLDPRIFGTPEMPRAFEGTPGITGLPVFLREVENGQFTKMKKKSPFGDKYIVMANGKLSLKAVDATATDAATTEDQLQFRASWQDKAGNTYEVRANKVAAHGLEFPTFGGVATNVILHGFTGLGTPLMPSEFTYVAFWGMGQVLKNGKVVDGPRLVHGMLTEYVRTEGYKLGFDKDVTPTRLQFHLMVAPFKPDMEHMSYMPAPVKTGFKLPNGMELPFWHVMFENLQISANRK
ncbi:MAG: hypothetical protein D6715_05165 [Calditrichaeota bacterium]|nr:MAG: hypothetical protein D6715_05165 [Calditrichota bacterium]